MLHDRINRHARHLGPRLNGEESVPGSDRYSILSQFLGGHIVRRDEGSFIKIVSDFDESYVHGAYAMYEMDRGMEYLSCHFSDVTPVEPVDKGNLLFLDTETTGLGGAGTVAFLVGLGSLSDSGFQVRQYFLPDFPDEAAMLEEIRSEFHENTVVVSYNGKTFDMPILRDRMIIQRVERHFETAGHIDLLHSARKLFRLRLGSCTLGNVEREVLSFYRNDDIPGELVPGIYFNWLATSDTELLDKVVEHNLYDIVSLYFLMHHISEIHHNPIGQIRDFGDLLSLVRIFERRRENKKIISLLGQFESSLANEGRADILMRRALAAKRLADFDISVPIWRQVAKSGEADSFSARIELAKYYEHRLRDYSSALNTALEAMEICPSHGSLRFDLEKRIKRLRKRLSVWDKS